MKKTIVFMSIGLAGLTLKASGSQGQLKANGSQGQQTRAEPLPAQVSRSPSEVGTLV